jgi:hypothetical protein
MLKWDWLQTGIYIAFAKMGPKVNLKGSAGCHWGDLVGIILQRFGELVLLKSGVLYGLAKVDT